LGAAFFFGVAFFAAGFFFGVAFFAAGFFFGVAFFAAGFFAAGFFGVFLTFFGFSTLVTLKLPDRDEVTVSQ
jgi:hypothetical protein